MLQLITVGALVLGMLVLGGCQRQARGGADVTGTYALVSVEGQKVPCTINHLGHGLPVASGSFIINGDGTCISRIALNGQNNPIEVKATYTYQDSKLTMKWQGAGTTVGTIQGNTFSMNNEGMAFVYQK